METEYLPFDKALLASDGFCGHRVTWVFAKDKADESRRLMFSWPKPSESPQQAEIRTKTLRKPYFIVKSRWLIVLGLTSRIPWERT